MVSRSGLETVAVIEHSCTKYRAVFTGRVEGFDPLREMVDPLYSV